MANAPDPAAVKASFRQPTGILKLVALVSQYGTLHKGPSRKDVPCQGGEGQPKTDKKGQGEGRFSKAKGTFFSIILR